MGAALNRLNAKDFDLTRVKKVLSLWAPENHGKTNTMRKLIDLLEKEKGASVKFSREWASPIKGEYGREFVFIFEYRGIRIGITTAGDSTQVMVRNARYFAKYQCDIVVVPVRSSANGVNLCAALAHEKLVAGFSIEERKIEWSDTNVADTLQVREAKKMLVILKEWVSVMLLEVQEGTK